MGAVSTRGTLAAWACSEWRSVFAALGARSELILSPAAARPYPRSCPWPLLSPPQPMPIRILLADDHAVVRDGLRSLVEREADMEVVAEASDGRECIQMALQF